MRLCGLICHPCVCVCVRVLCHHVCVCVCVRCVRCVCAVCVRVLWQSGAACGRADLFATRVRVMCHHVCVCVVCGVWCVYVCVCACVALLLWQSGAACGSADLFVTHVCVCVCVCCATACVCMWWWWWCSVCVRTCWPFAVAVWDCMRLCGLICHPLVRVMCHHVCVCVCACVCVCVPALCSGSWLLHAAVRTYLSPACVCDVRPLLWQSGAVCGCADLLFGPSLWQSGAGCACADLCVGPLLCQSGVACGCADLLSTFLRV